MLDYLSSKKSKKNKADQTTKSAKEEAGDSVEAGAGSAGNAANHSNSRSEHLRHHVERNASVLSQPPVLDLDDESFLESILSDDSPPPPLPPRRIKTPVIDSDTSGDERPTKELSKRDAKGKDTEKEDETKDKKPSRMATLFRRQKKNADSLEPEDNVSPAEAEREKKDLGSVLDRLNLSTKNNKVISMSNDTSEVLRKFTNVFKDLANGVPTAYGDLIHLIDDRNEIISKSFDKLPKSLQKLVVQLPEKITGSLAPEILAKAAESQGIELAAGASSKAAASQLFSPKNIMELVTTPGALAGMLRAIVSALKTRWPAFMGVNVLWSVALFLLMLVLWYCHKRGREVRLDREKSEGEGDPVEAGDRIEELPDDPQLPAAGSETTAEEVISPSGTGLPVLPRPPIGDDAPRSTDP